jgi:8-oxo-dGTP pyrophosphatase MutT (NUDIX family)
MFIRDENCVKRRRGIAEVIDFDVLSILAFGCGRNWAFLRELNVRQREGLMARTIAGLARRLSRTDLPVQVAAVCCRLTGSTAEFLLVHTSSGRWTFPKGHLHPKISASESAAREAWEEAGATGRIEERHFGAYLDNKRGLGRETGTRWVRIMAFLFEVHSTVPPKDRGRHPNWFSVRDAKRQLAQGRSAESARQIARIIDSAAEGLMSNNRHSAPLPLGAPGTRSAFV